MTVELVRKRCLVTGASRGLGLEFVRQWLAEGRRVFALSRRPQESPALRELGDRYPDRLSAVACDVVDDGSVVGAAERVGEVTGALDILVNNAGIFGSHGDAPLERLDLDEIRGVMEVNALAPLRVARAFLPLLRHGERPVLGNMSSLMGSIGDNGSGGSWAYRMSKAALNMATRNLAHQLARDGVVSVVLHPGWVRTDMGGPSAPLETPDAVAAMVGTLDRIGPTDSGRFLDREGRELPW